MFEQNQFRLSGWRNSVRRSACILILASFVATSFGAAQVYSQPAQAPAKKAPAPIALKPSFDQLRATMVREDLAGQGIKNERVLHAFKTVQRHEFVPPQHRANAYFDMAIPIGESQTISAPFIVAYMTEQLEPQPD